MDLLPAGVLSYDAGPLHVQLLILGVAGQVIPQCAQKNKCHKSAQENDHHKRVEDAEPVDLVFEEVVLEVTVEASGEGLGGRLPVHGVGVAQSGAHLQWHGVLGGEVHLDNLVVVVAQTETAVGEDVLQTQRHPS